MIVVAKVDVTGVKLTVDRKTIVELDTSSAVTKVLTSIKVLGTALMASRETIVLLTLMLR
jgi:hypothetical protein